MILKRIVRSSSKIHSLLTPPFCKPTVLIGLLSTVHVVNDTPIAIVIINNNNSLHLYSAFLSTQRALHCGGVSPRPVCSIHLDDAMAAIVRQTAHHTPAYWWRGDRVMKPINIWGWGQRPMGKFGQDAEVTPLLFSKDILGFLMTTESQDLGLTSHPKDGACWQYSVPVTILGR